MVDETIPSTKAEGEVISKDGHFYTKILLDGCAERDIVSVEFARQLVPRGPYIREKYNHSDTPLELADGTTIKTYGIYYIYLKITDSGGYKYKFIRPYIAIDRPLGEPLIILGRPGLKDLKVI